MPLSKYHLEGIEKNEHHRFEDLAKLQKELKETDELGRTLLHHAVLKKREFWVYAFIYAGACLNQKDKEGNTALDLALETKHRNIINCLIRYDAEAPNSTKALQKWEKSEQAITDNQLPEISSELLEENLPKAIAETTNIESSKTTAFLKYKLGEKQKWYDADIAYERGLYFERCSKAIERELAKRAQTKASLESKKSKSEKNSKI